VTKKLNFGVSQGSNLGPILFLVYVNSIFNIFLNCEVFMFADDLLIIVSHKNFKEAEKILQRNANFSAMWSHNHKLIINVQKTKIMHFFNKCLRKDELPCIKIHSNACLHTFNPNCNCNLIDPVKEFIYLGVKLDNDMSWKPQIIAVICKLRSVLSQIYM
jgi:hypothetical protein